jgi:hypothetical protein
MSELLKDVERELQSLPESEREAQRTKFAVFVVHNKLKPKRGQLPPEVPSVISHVSVALNHIPGTLFQQVLHWRRDGRQMVCICLPGFRVKTHLSLNFVGWIIHGKQSWCSDPLCARSLFIETDLQGHRRARSSGSRQ